MATTPAMDTMRTKVLDAILAMFPQRGTPAGATFEATHGVVFSLATREPLGALPKGKISALGVYGGTSERSLDYPFADVKIPVVIEVHLAKEPNVPVSKTAERYLGVVEYVLKTGVTPTGLVYAIEVTGDNVDIDSPYAEQVDGALYFDVKFSQNTNDPTRGRT